MSILRSLSYGLMMVNRQTLLVTLGTVVRLAALAGILAALTQRLQGAVVGVIALSSCIAVESIYAVALGSRFYRRLQRRTQDPPGYRELWRFSWPIILMQTAESVAYIEPALRTGIVLALAMAAAGVCRGLLIASRRTGFIAVTAGIRIAAAAVVGSAGLALGVTNGATLGLAALVAAFASEALVLGHRLHTLDRRTPRLFER